MVSLILAASMATAPVSFRAMTFNIWVGGTQSQPLEKTIEAIQFSKSDIVGIQEPGPNLPKIAEGLNWNRSDKASIVTKYEIVEDWKVQGNSWGGAKLKLPDGSLVLVYNDHFNAYPYGPYEIRDRKANTATKAIAVEQNAGRVDQMKRALANLAARPDRTLPVVFTGDFNTPSHLDWVQSTKGRNFGLVVNWPVTNLAEAAGFKDGFRTMYPNPVTRPGFTWSPGYPVGKLEANDVMDRIDFVLYRGALRPRKAWVVGETGPVTDLAFDPWPSDHRAVAVDFELTGSR